MHGVRLSDVVKLHIEPANPFNNNAVAIFSDGDTKLEYVSVKRALLMSLRLTGR